MKLAWSKKPKVTRFQRILATKVSVAPIPARMKNKTLCSKHSDETTLAEYVAEVRTAPFWGSTEYLCQECAERIERKKSV